MTVKPMTAKQITPEGQITRSQWQRSQCRKNGNLWFHIFSSILEK